MAISTRLRELYGRDGIRGVVTGIGRFFYWKSGLRSARNVVGYRLAGPTVSQTIAEEQVRFVADSTDEYGRYRDFVHEREVLETLVGDLESDDVVFDVGANTGVYTVSAAKAIHGIEVVAFEPHPTNRERLSANLQANEVDAMVLEHALTDESGSVTLAAPEGDASGGKFSLADSTGTRVIEAEARTGDELGAAGTGPAPTVLKIDVEGAEAAVLRGLEDTLGGSQCRRVLCEVHPDLLEAFGDDPAEVETLLSSAGFDVEVLKHRSDEYFLWGKR